MPRVSHETRRWSGRIGLALLLALGLAYLPYRLLDGTGVSDAPRLRSELSESRVESERLRRENLQLARECEALRTDPTAIEDIARDEIGMVHPGEIVIRVEPSPP
ncbi:MAG TPA: septum formation initiator family protein, partial [Kofleriaceae bacterium]|nr:septum formation initiator family protein [Kofleriaceae bacterium]